MTTLARLLPIKPGVDFAFYADYSLGGVAEVFSATDLTCHARSKNNELLTVMTIVAGTIDGRFIISASGAQTLAWPTGDVFFDIRRVTGGVTTQTDTFVVEVLRRQTV